MTKQKEAIACVSAFACVPGSTACISLQHVFWILHFKPIKCEKQLYLVAKSRN